jgi:protein-export membrane protein SecD
MASKSKGLVIAAVVFLVLAVLAATGVILVAAGIFVVNRPATLAEVGGIEMTVRTAPGARDEIVEIYRQRLDAMDLPGIPNILTDGEDGIVVQVPGPVDSEILTRALLLRAQLEFRAVSAVADTFESTQLDPGVEVLWSFETDSMTGQRSRAEAHAVLPEVRVDGTMIADATVEIDQFDTPYVALEFDAVGRAAFCQLTDDYTGSLIAIVLDDEVMSAPLVMEPICGGQARITLGAGNVDLLHQEAQVLASSLRAGALPAAVTLESTRVITPGE